MFVEPLKEQGGCHAGCHAGPPAPEPARRGRRPLPGTAAPLRKDGPPPGRNGGTRPTAFFQ